MKPVHVCPMCKCEKRRSRAKLPMDEVNRDAAIRAVRELVVRYGSIRKAGRAYSERFELLPRSGERLLTRVLSGDVRTSYYTLDRLEMLVLA